MHTSGPIVFTGFMGCGKSVVAREIASQLGVTMVDLDDAITEIQGKSPARMISEDGEPAFRLVETAILERVLQGLTTGVIALGGGAWIREANRNLVSQYRGLSIWLDTPFAVCWERIETSGADRPLGSSQHQARELFQQRLPVYQLAEIRIVPRADEDLDSLVRRVRDEITEWFNRAAN
jgi:shikimate kinase